MSRATIIDHATSVATLYGHDPRDVREWPWRDVQLLLLAHYETGFAAPGVAQHSYDGA